jgi:hypothetical protein
MYTPRQTAVRSAIKPRREPELQEAGGSSAALAQRLEQHKPARKSARRLTRNPALASIINNALRMWK